MAVGYNIGIQMKRKELTMTFMMISEGKNTLWFRRLYKIFQCFKG